MNVLRTAIWVILTALLVAFAALNWEPVNVKIWPASDPRDTLVWSTKLPAVILISFLIGFLPTWFTLRAAKWSLKRRLDSSERQLADLRAQVNRPPEPAPQLTTETVTKADDAPTPPQELL